MKSSVRSLLVAGAAALVVLAAAGPAFARARGGSAKVDRAVREALGAGGATQSVIITVKPGFRDTIRKALQDHGDLITHEHPLIDALSVVLHSDDVDEIAKQPWVEAVSADAYVYAKGAAAGAASAATSTVTSLLGQTSGTSLRATLGLPRIAPGYGSTTGTGVAVAIVDSGIAPSDDFAGRITAFYDFTKGGRPSQPFDDYGHGTHVAGLIGSSGHGSNYEFQGIAPDVDMVGFKVLDGNGRGKTSDVIRALEYITANHRHLHIKVVNLSLGHPIYAPAKYDPLVQAVERASAAGLIVVTASGNYGEKERTGEPGYTGVVSPGNAPSAITVGAAMTQDTVSRLDDVVADYSSRGPTWFDAFAKPDVVAPGHQLSSDSGLFSYLYKLLKQSRGKSKNGMPMLKLSGTSMAAAVTTGVVALMVEASTRNDYRNWASHRNNNGDHALTANLAKAILQFSAIPLRDADYLTQGAGEINAAGAIALAKAINTDARPGSYWLDTGVPAATVIGGRTYGWSQRVIWGDTVLSGNVVYVSNIVWGTNIMWGTQIVWGASATAVGDNIVWGTNSVWGANIVWSDRVIGQADGDNIVWGTLDGDNIVWGTSDGDNIVWGTWDGDNIVWGTSDGDNIVWGTSDGDNIVWGTAKGDNIVWGTAVPGGKGGKF